MIDEKLIKNLALQRSDKAKKDRLYMAIRSNDAAEIERLRAEGAVLSDHIKAMLRYGGGGTRLPDLNEYSLDWYSFGCGLSSYSIEEFVSVVRNLRAELGEPLFYSAFLSFLIIPRFDSAEVFGCVLDCFDNKKIKKDRLLTYFIDNNMTDAIAVAAGHGWLRRAKKCDEYIEYARSSGCVESAAWLLDFKCRTFDLDGERVKTEKRRMAELSAAPDSITVMKKLWNWKTREDGTLVITGYKGDRTEIAVPSEIGGDIVTAIGGYAFSPDAARLRVQQRDLRRKITSVRLPDTITDIDNAAFYHCSALQAVVLHKGTYAERYCLENNILFVYVEGD